MASTDPKCPECGLPDKTGIGKGDGDWSCGCEWGRDREPDDDEAAP